MPTKPAAGLLTLLFLGSTLWWNSGSAQVAAPSADVIAAGEEIIHRRLGSEKAGEPTVALALTAGRLDLEVVDAETGQAVPCRVNVIGPEGNYYEPDSNPLALWSLKRSGNREGKGPFRYYGWYFYSPGVSHIEVPPGNVTVEVWKGFEYEPVVQEVRIDWGRPKKVKIALKRAIDMAARRWISGDPHIHIRRAGVADDEPILDLMAAEDLRFSQILCFNENRNYKPEMGAQWTPQFNGFGAESIRRDGIYSIMSGQEYRGSAFGHILHLGASRIVDADGAQTNTDNWPPFGVVADEVHGLGGISFHAHGGYEKEIYADFAQSATDGVELLQFAIYRGIGLTGWYHMLNAGYRFPAMGASDFPYCRALGDCRTYVKIDKPEPTFADWNGGLKAGRSFFTTGPLLDFRVNGATPGETLKDIGAGDKLEFSLQVDSLVAPFEEIEILVGGNVAVREKLKRPQKSLKREWSVPVEGSTWVAARVFAAGTGGRENVEAHTNPVYVVVPGTTGVQADSVQWLLKKLEERIQFHQSRNFAEKEKVLEWFGRSRRALDERLRGAGGGAN